MRTDRRRLALPALVILLGLFAAGGAWGGALAKQVSDAGGRGGLLSPELPPHPDQTVGASEQIGTRVDGEVPLRAASQPDWKPLRESRRQAWRDEPPPPAYKIAVAQDGVYQLTYADLEAAGLPVAEPGIDPQTFQLSNLGQEVAIHVDDGGDGAFEPGDAILFYGRGLDTKYTDTNVYWLTYGHGLGVRMASRDVTPSGTAPVSTSFATTLRLEENHLRDARVLMGPDDDNWYWKRVMAIGANFAITQTVTFTLTHLSREPFSATLRTNLHGLTHPEEINPDHHVQVRLNGHLVDDVWWDGFTDVVTATTMPSSYLREGSNAISVWLPHDTGADNDALYTNWFEIEYRRTTTVENDSLAFSQNEAGPWQYEVGGFSDADTELFDISDPAHVTRLVSPTVAAADGTYTLTFEDVTSDTMTYRVQTTAQRLRPASVERDAPADLLDPENGAAYVIIIHGDLAVEGSGEKDDVYDLAAYRSGQGLQTMIVDVEDVYDTFSYGIFDPEAIHSFLEHAYGNWPPPTPRYVLLVGSGHYDFRGYTTGEPNYIPPYLVYLGEHLGEVAADNRYATVADGDVLPDLAIGRLPVSSVSELATVVDKILSYEQSPPTGDWTRQALFVADNQPDMEEQAGDFWDLSDEVVDGYLPAAYEVERIYYDKFADEPVPGHPDPPRPEPPYYDSAEDARTAIVAGISEGALLVNYFGHGWVDGWTQEGVFDTDDVAALRNEDKLPMLLSMTCETSDFSVPDAPSLDGSLVRAEGGGAIGTWGCTAEGQSTAHRYLDRGFLGAVLGDDVTPIGDAAVQGKVRLYESTTAYRDLIDTFTLLGDPATRLHPPPMLNHHIHLPMVLRQDNQRRPKQTAALTRTPTVRRPHIGVKPKIPAATGVRVAPSPAPIFQTSPIKLTSLYSVLPVHPEDARSPSPLVGVGLKDPKTR